MENKIFLAGEHVPAGIAILTSNAGRSLNKS